MKKILTLIILLFVLSFNSFGQFKFGLGATVEIADFFGVTGKAKYQINEDFAGQASFSYYFEDFTFWTIDLDVLYGGFDIGDTDGFYATPFAGLQIATVSVDLGSFGGNVSDTDLGVNLGIQGNLPINDDLEFFIEPKITIGGGEGVYVAAGIYF
jgi:hypothetical protein